MSDEITKDTVLKTWMGVTRGSYLGRDDGYPERKFRCFESIEEAVEGEIDPNDQFFKLVPVSREEVFHARAQYERDQRAEQRRNLDRQIEQLSQKRDELGDRPTNPFRKENNPFLPAPEERR